MNVSVEHMSSVNKTESGSSTQFERVCQILDIVVLRSFGGGANFIHFLYEVSGKRSLALQKELFFF